MVAHPDSSESAFWYDSEMPFLSSGAPFFYVYLPISSITKETNPHMSTVKNLPALSLQGRVHVVTATESGRQQDQKRPWK